MTGIAHSWLRQDVIAEPLINQWYAWTFLISPATAARFLTHSQMTVMQSFIDAPDVHISALKNPELVGGPFIQYGADRVDDIRQLLEHTKAEQFRLLALSEALDQLNRLLAAHPAGAPMEELYRQVPEPLQGFVELVYDGNNHPAVRYQEALLYRSEYYQPGNQSIALRLLPDSDHRAFVLSTPRLEQDVEVLLRAPFADPVVDALFKARHTPVNVQELATRLNLQGDAYDRFSALFTDTPPRSVTRYNGPGLRVRYLGHACVLVETAETAILVDPLLSYDHSDSYGNTIGLARFSYQDLPPFIDYVLITHNHQDHVMLETLLQLRHKIGEVLVPAGHRGSLIDPSLRLALRQIGFANVQEVEHLDSIEIPNGNITPFPFLGEHGDLDIATKAAWRIEAHNRSLMCVADSDNLDNHLYDHLAQLFGPVDILFIGMECEGAPYTWAYGPLLPAAVSHRQAQSRRLNGSDADRAWRLVQRLQPQQVYVYAMGQEPWLNYITSIHYTDQSLAIIESNKLVAQCQSQGMTSSRLLGKAEFELMPTQRESRDAVVLPVSVSAQAPVSTKSVLLSVTSPAPRLATHLASATDELSTLLDDLHATGIQLSVNDGNLRVNAPKGTLTPELTARIKLQKPALLGLLQNAATTSVAEKTENPLPEDARLPTDLRPLSVVDFRERNVLLTGCTGFVGAFLLFELLRQTDAHIHCVLRFDEHAGTDTGIARIRKTLNRYNLWQENFIHRIHPISGDLTLPQLGIADAIWNQLAGSVDALYHNGAHVHHLLPYEQLRSANVGGTLELLRLCCVGNPKRFHYISSLSVLPPPAQANGRIFQEGEPLAPQPVPAGGYNRSKWTAEQLVRQAMQRGLTATIHRPGPVSGDSRTGVFNDQDFLYRLMQGYVRSGMAPTGEMPLDLLPVDYLASAIIYLSRQDQAMGTTSHLLHPNPVSSNVLFEACENAGIHLRRIPYAEWFAHLRHIAQEKPDHPLYPLVALFASRIAGDKRDAHALALPYSTENTQALLAQAPFSLPDLDVRLFSRYLNAMQQVGNLQMERV